MNYTDEQIKDIVKNVIQTPSGFEFIEILLDRLGAFERGCNFQNIEQEYFNKGKKEQGLWLLDLVRESHFNNFIEIQRKRRNEKCQKMKQLQAD